MRKSKAETAETRRRIVETASAEFRSHGISSIGLSDLMAAAGLTHGGFYKHFGSKEQLIEESVALAAKTMVDNTAITLQNTPGRKGLQGLIDVYLSIEHRDDCANGCPFVALGGEVSRGSAQVRQVMAAGFVKLVDIIAGQFSHLALPLAKQEAQTLLCAMIGAVAMSRIMIDTAASAAILKQTREQLSQRLDAIMAQP